MKIDFAEHGGNANRKSDLRLRTVSGETQKLAEVMLSRPDFLAPVPCCSVTRESLRHGFDTDRARALGQHNALRALLERHEVTCHFVPAVENAPDLSFTRDVAVTTPWGLVALNPALAHRRAEVDHLLAAAAAIDIHPVARIETGTIEGGDVCIVRPGLVIIGCSGERTDAQGADALATLFRRFGWDALIYPFDAHFLHLDTFFCMLDSEVALACVDVLDDWFLAALSGRGIRLLPVRYKEARGLGCNILSLDGRTIVMASGHDRVAREVERAGFAIESADISEFTACGGGIHCLTMPLARVGRP